MVRLLSAILHSRRCRRETARARSERGWIVRFRRGDRVAVNDDRHGVNYCPRRMRYRIGSLAALQITRGLRGEVYFITTRINHS